MDKMLEALELLAQGSRGYGLTEHERALCSSAYLYGKVDGSKSMMVKALEAIK